MGCRAGSLMVRVSAWCSFCRDFGDGGADGGFLDEVLVVDEIRFRRKLMLGRLGGVGDMPIPVTVNLR